MDRKMKLVANREYIKLISLYQGYESWTISYSDGLVVLPNGRFKNLWRWPRFHHVKVSSCSNLEQQNDKQTG